MTESTIPLTNETMKRLESCKLNPNETYDESIDRLIDEADDDLTLEDIEDEGLRKAIEEGRKTSFINKNEMLDWIVLE